jgi:CTP synthase
MPNYKFSIKNTKFIAVTGGVCSSLGKGILISSIGTLLKNANYNVSVIKLDPYLNVDPGTMSPHIHGEVFVTDDGAETDLDLGHYERILDINLTKSSSISSGQIFKEILDKEREGYYLGRDIQMVPHVVDIIKNRLYNFADKNKFDYILTEIGGTVGDLEAEIFLETLRQIRIELPNQFLHCHLSYVPYLGWANEVKTKPTQHSMLQLKRLGLIPDFLFLRVEHEIKNKISKKLEYNLGIPQKHIFQVPTFKPVYKIFKYLYDQDLHLKIQEKFNLEQRDSNLTSWINLTDKISKKQDKMRIGLVAKYMGENDPYLSVIEAIKSAGYANDRDIEITLIDSENLNSIEKLKALDGIVIPGGFDSRGIEGKILSAKYARENKIPFLGLCMGMQIMLIEFARNVLNIKDATSAEFNPKSKDCIIVPMQKQLKIKNKGATMRLGLYPCRLKEGTKTFEIYKKKEIYERHRHRYEFNNKYRKLFEKADMIFSGIYEKENLVEISELKDHPFMIASQFHPEFLSKPLKPHPLFDSFIKNILSKELTPSYSLINNINSTKGEKRKIYTQSI